MRDEGKEALTVWLSRDTKLRLEDLASIWHTTTSEMVEQALAQFQPGSPPRLGNDTETLQLQASVEAVLERILPAHIQAAMQAVAFVTATNGNVTATEHLETPAPVYDAPHGHSLVTEPLPGASQVTPTALEAQICTWLREHPEGESVKGLVAALGVSENAVRLRMNALVKSGQIQMHGAGRTLRYFFAEDSGSE
jgi:predicted transcriptional regulator